MKKSVTELYREIGAKLRQEGAEHVVLLSSKNDKKTYDIIELQIAVEGIVNKEKIESLCQQLWPEIQMEILIHDEYSGEALYREMIEEGIRL